MCCFDSCLVLLLVCVAMLEYSRQSNANVLWFLTVPSGSKSQSNTSMGSEEDVLDDVVVPPDLPLEAIAEEVQNSWHLKV